MEGFVIRNYSPEDFDSYYALYKSVVSTRSWETTEKPQQVKRQIFDTPFHHHEDHWLAFHKDELVGSAWASSNPTYRERHGPYSFSDMMVHPRYRRSGVGKELLKFLKIGLVQQRVLGIDAFVEKRYEEAIGFLESQDFKRQNNGFIKMERDLSILEQPAHPDGFTIHNPNFPNDLDRVVENLNACCVTLEDHIPYSREFIGTRAYIMDPSQHPGGFVAVKDKKIIGTAFSTLERRRVNHEDTIVGGVYAVGVLPEHRRLGLGRSLVSKSLGWIKHHGGKSAYLYLSSNNAGAFSLYQNMGFKELERGYKYRLEFNL